MVPVGVIESLVAEGEEGALGLVEGLRNDPKVRLGGSVVVSGRGRVVVIGAVIIKPLSSSESKTHLNSLEWH